MDEGGNVVISLARRRTLGKVTRAVVQHHENCMSNPCFQGLAFRWSDPPDTLLSALVPVCVPFDMTEADHRWVSAVVAREWRKVQARHVGEP